MSGTSTTILIIATVMFLVSVMTLAFSTYGLGKEEGNKSGPAYQAATAFTMIGASGVIISLFIILYSSMSSPRSISAINNAQ